MQVSAEALGGKSARRLLASGADEVLIPCIGRVEDAIDKAARIDGPTTVHTPANRIADPDAVIDRLKANGLEHVLLVSGNPGHGRGTRTIYELIPHFRQCGIHVSVGAYPEDYFTRTSRAHRAKSAGILVDKQAAGAQRVITQASFSPSNIRQWLQVVRSRGVVVPIHVGVMARVPRKTLASFMRQARAEIFSHPRMQAANKPNLDLFFRMLRSTMPRPERFVSTVRSFDEMGSEDGLHVFSYGADVSRLIAAAHGVDVALKQANGATADPAS
jgi:hypothetical protein